MTLGAQEVAPLTMAAAYATFAADGIYCKPIAITSIKSLTGRTISVPKPSCDKAMDENIARGVTSALEDVLSKGTARGVRKLGRPAAGKTGTANVSRSNFFVGYTPQVASAVWFGHPAAPTPLKNIDTGVRRYPGYSFGATVAAPIWADFMVDALRGKPVEQFGQASDKLLNGDKITIPSTYGMTISEARSTLKDAGFDPTVGGTLSSSAPSGAVAGTSPRSGVRTTRGATVTIYTSRGQASRAFRRSPSTTFTATNVDQKAAKKADATKPAKGDNKKGGDNKGGKGKGKGGDNKGGKGKG
jgi:membrane peptidoglycan carboxypeptidase